MSAEDLATKTWATALDAALGLAQLMLLTNNTNEYSSGLKTMLSVWAGALTTWRTIDCRGSPTVLHALDQIMKDFQTECLRLRSQIHSQSAFNEAIAISLVRSV